MTDMPGIRSGSAPPTAGDGFALVEMFTSQGCNSYPPAEDVLSEIDRDARERGSPVYALASKSTTGTTWAGPTRSAPRRTPCGRRRTRARPGDCRSGRC
jgi:hypothetical protein